MVLQGRNNIKYLVDRGVNIWNKDAFNWYKKVIYFLEPVLDNKEIYKSLGEFVEAVKQGVEFEIPALGYKLGDVGRNYSIQWRDWRNIAENAELHENDYSPIFEPTSVDQISQIIKSIRERVMNRRNIVTAWNPDETNQTALPPCHWAFELLPRPLYNFEKEEYFLGKEFGLDLKWHQRSVDTFLGLPFNIGSYSILNHFFS